MADRVIEVGCCWDCPFAYSYEDSTECTEMESRWVGDIDIDHEWPDWCPLRNGGRVIVRAKEVGGE